MNYLLILDVYNSYHSNLINIANTEANINILKAKVYNIFIGKKAINYNIITIIKYNTYFCPISI